MAIEWQILGFPGKDNSLLVTVDTGQARETILFDCGQSCLDELRVSAIQSIESVCFSHYHMDHVAGFDSFFRHNYNRPGSPVNVWGPPGTLELMGHRFLGFSWNLHANQPGEWVVREIGEKSVTSAKFITAEAFARPHPLPEAGFDSAGVQRTKNFRLEARLLPHATIPSAAYRIVEPDRQNVDPAALHGLSLTPGPWLQVLSDDSREDSELVAIDGQDHSLGSLRQRLLSATPGHSIAYLTDFRIEPGTPEWEETVSWLTDTTVLVCECQYRLADRALAIANGHMTADLVGRLAREAKVGRLVLHHLSRRYAKDEWMALRDEVRVEYSRAEFPLGWFPES